MKKAKSSKRTNEWHASKSQIGMGDHYGTGIRNPVGKVRDVMGINNFKPKALKKAPKSLA